MKRVCTSVLFFKDQTSTKAVILMSFRRLLAQQARLSS